MREDDKQQGWPFREYRDTKANVAGLGLGAADEGCIAYATDTDELGTYDGAAWAWGTLSGLPNVAAAGYALVSDGVNSWAVDQTPLWTGEHAFEAGIAFTGASGVNEITVPDNTAIALELLDAGGLEYLRVVSTDANPYFLIDPAGAGIGVGIGTLAVPHGGVGAAKFAIDGTDASVAGPHVQFTTASDDHPLFQQLNWAHDNINLIFDAYFDGAWKSSDAGSNAAIAKNGDELCFRYDSGVAQGGAVTWNDGIVLDLATGYVGVGHSGPVYRLDVRTDIASYVAYFFNDGNADNHEGIKVQCCLDTNPAGVFMACLDGNGTAVGAVKGDGAGGVTLWSASDERIKNVLGSVDVKLAMEALIKVDPIQYVGKGQTAKTGRKNLGFSAQDIHQYFPEVATYDEQAGLYGIDYARLTSVLWAQNKALLARIKALELH